MGPAAVLVTAVGTAVKASPPDKLACFRTICRNLNTEYIIDEEIVIDTFNFFLQYNFWPRYITERVQCCDEI